MKLRKLYTNNPKIFSPIIFNDELNVVFGNIQCHKDTGKDTHNIGKTTLGILLNFCLLSEDTKNIFLSRRRDIFSSLVFFLEIELLDGSFLTIRRSVESPSKIHIMLHDTCNNDFSEFPSEHWDHHDLTVPKAKQIIDGRAKLLALKSWSYREYARKFIRLQTNFLDTFGKPSSASKDKNWKPFVAFLLGVGADIAEYYRVKEQLEAQSGLCKSKTLASKDLGQVNGSIDVKKQERKRLLEDLETLDFQEEDRRYIDELVQDIEVEVAELNTSLYHRTQELRKIENSLVEGKLIFDPDAVSQLFKEARILFPEQIKKDYETLIKFNRDITSERNTYLREEKKDIQKDIAKICGKLEMLHQRRANLLTFITDKSILDKYKQLNRNIIDVEVEIAVLEKKRLSMMDLLKEEQKREELKQSQQKIISEIKTDITAIQEADAISRFRTIRTTFNNVINNILNTQAILSITVNSEGNINFNASTGDNTQITDEGEGYSYKKLLCVGYDLAVIHSYLLDDFPRFVFHDGVFEGLDNRKKKLLLEQLRSFSRDGIQIIITVISSDCPEDCFDEGEIVLHLNDRDDKGRLFKIPKW